MALASAIEWDVQTGGSDNNGGGFKAGASGTDRSQSTTVQATLTTLSVVNADTTKITVSLTDYTVLAADVGNVYQNTGGTSTAGFYEITAVDTGLNTWTLDRSIGTAAQTCTGKMGGCLATVTKVSGAVAVAGNMIWLKAGTYTLTTTWTVGGGGSKGDTTNGRIKLHGYSSAHGDYAGMPIITSTTVSLALLNLNDADYWEFRHLVLSHSAATRGNAISCVTSASTPVYLKDIIIDGCLGISAGGNSPFMAFEDVEMMNCTNSTQTINVGTVGMFSGCEIHDNAGDGIRTTGGTTNTLILEDCTFDGNDYGVNDVSTNSNVVITARNCVFEGNGLGGLKTAAKAANSTTLELVNNTFYGNTGIGIEQLDTQVEVDANMRINRNNAFGANSGGNYSGISAGIGEITLTADPFTNAAARNFSPNNTAGGGALLRAARFPGVAPSGDWTSYGDVGPIQHQDSGGAAAFVGADEGMLFQFTESW